MNDDLHLSSAGANLIKHFEGCLEPHGGKYRAYSCPAGVTTIGWGTTSEHGHKISKDTVWTMEQCDAAFLRDMEVFERTSDALLLARSTAFSSIASPASPTTSGLEISPNLRCSKKSTLVISKARQREFLKWNKANGKVLAGLTRRRKARACCSRASPTTITTATPTCR